MPSYKEGQHIVTLDNYGHWRPGTIVRASRMPGLWWITLEGETSSVARYEDDIKLFGAVGMLYKLNQRVMVRTDEKTNDWKMATIKSVPANQKDLKSVYVVKVDNSDGVCMRYKKDIKPARRGGLTP